MPREHEDVLLWLRQVLDHSQPMPEKLDRLAGASFTMNLEVGTQNINVECEDGSRFAVMVLTFSVSTARREELDRETERRKAELRAAEAADPSLKEKRLSRGRRLAETFRAIHAEKHRGTFAACTDDMCEMARSLASSLTSDDDTPDLEIDFDCGTVN